MYSLWRRPTQPTTHSNCYQFALFLSTTELWIQINNASANYKAILNWVWIPRERNIGVHINGGHTSLRPFGVTEISLVGLGPFLHFKLFQFQNFVSAYISIHKHPPVRPRNDDNYHHRSYCFVERKNEIDCLVDYARIALIITDRQYVYIIKISYVVLQAKPMQYLRSKVFPVYCLYLNDDRIVAIWPRATTVSSTLSVA